jgi:hypothetical protein
MGFMLGLRCTFRGWKRKLDLTGRFSGIARFVCIVVLRPLQREAGWFSLSSTLLEESCRRSSGLNSPMCSRNWQSMKYWGRE